MTTLKPHLVRADTLDLQDHLAPSAKDHSRQPAHPAPYGYGPAAPHHAQSLRHAEEESYQQQKVNPRLSSDHSRPSFQHQHQFYDEAEDELEDDSLIHHNGVNGLGPHDGDSDDGDGPDMHDDDLDDDLMDKISSSPSIEDEDIDFEFVYALHTFVATVEGQANATKGDTMVLLDDSNSYWWLVRVVKDGSIGYLPAEHIETPTERLARLNKHRNIDLSASMLGDNPEKSKNPLKKAMRRRNAKTVQFTAPTYYEPSEYDYSDDEEEEDEESQLENVDAGPQADHDELDEPVGAEESVHHGVNEVGLIPNGVQRATPDEYGPPEQASSPVKQDSVESPFAQGQEDAILRSRKGIVRNTDSFYKDDTAETRKISLTPRLLRNDSESTVATDPEIQQRPSQESFDKLIGVEEKPKEAARKKEKKGMLSALFKRKEKGGKVTRPEGEEAEKEKASEDTLRPLQSAKDSAESLLVNAEATPERRPSKLQKHPPSNLSPKASPTESRAPQRDVLQAPEPMAHPPAPIGPAPPPPTQLAEEVRPPPDAPATNSPHDRRREQTPNRFPSLTEKRSIFSPITTALHSATSTTGSNQEPVVKGVYSKRAKNRFAIEESDSEDDRPSTTAPRPDARSNVWPGPDEHGLAPRTDSGMQVSSMEPLTGAPLEMERPLADRSPPTAFPSMSAEHTPTAPYAPVELDASPEAAHTANTSKTSLSTATHTPSTSRSTPTWSDASLRTYMENDREIRDLLIIVHDKTNVMPVGPDHPLMGNLFASERAKLAEMQAQLDSMLTGWMAKKSPGLLSQ